MKRTVRLFSFLLSLPLLAACQGMEAVTGIATDIAVQSGTISNRQADTVLRGSRLAGRAFEEFTPENEYYLGRTVAASILSRYRAHANPARNRYLNVVGQTVARASDKPETFGGYRFLILDSDEINAFAAPGGLILVTRGLIRCCRTEDALAAVLAHEIAHVQLAHGIGAIRASRYTALGQAIGTEIARNLGGEPLSRVAELFDGSVGDIIKTLVDHGYQSSQEYEADRTALEILGRVGYDPAALGGMLAEMERRLAPGAGGFGKTHPSPRDRLGRLAPLPTGTADGAGIALRRDRFLNTMRGI